MGAGGRGEEPVDRRRASMPLIYVAAFLGLVLCGLGVAAFMVATGATQFGDSPAYAQQAQSYGHLSPQVSWAVNADRHSLFYGQSLLGFPEVFRGPHGMVSPFEPGLGLLLVPFVAAGGLVVGSTLGMVCLSTAGLMLIHRRLTSLVGLQGRGQWLLGIALLGPATWLALTQVYPDFLAGVVLTVGVIELATVERLRTVDTTSAAIVAVAAGLLPWLQIKNLVPAGVLIIAWAALAFRRSTDRRRTRWLASATCASAVLSWTTLLGYNWYYLGHLLGLPEPTPKVGLTAMGYVVGLVLDREQGLLVQLPFAIFGVLGLWLARRRFAISVIATSACIGSILFLNGTYVGNPYGGDSLAGRFMWTLMPLLTSWSAITICTWQCSHRRLAVPIVLTVASWVYEAGPVVGGAHHYYNPTYDRLSGAAYPGWWRGLDGVLPQFGSPGLPLGSPVWSTAAEIALLAALLLGHRRYVRPSGAGRHRQQASLAQLAPALSSRPRAVATPPPP